MAKILSLTLLGALTLASQDAAAYGETQEVVPADQAVTAYGQSENFELVVRAPPGISTVPGPCQIFLSDFATNRPIPDARIQLSIQGPAAATVVARPTASPGVYEAEAAFPREGNYELQANVTSGQTTESLPLSGLRMKARAVSSVPDLPPPAWLGIGAAVATACFSTYLWRQRQRASGGT